MAANPQTKPTDLGCRPSPSPFIIIITQHESWFVLLSHRG